MRVFLDANILFSAAKSNGAVRLFLKLITDAGHQCCADEYVAEEARRNLVAKAPKAVAELESILATIDVAALEPAPSDVDFHLPLPEKDRPVLVSAIRLRCAALVTGDHAHFGPLYGKTIRGVKIYSPRQFAEAHLV